MQISINHKEWDGYICLCKTGNSCSLGAGDFATVHIWLRSQEYFLLCILFCSCYFEKENHSWKIPSKLILSRLDQSWATFSCPSQEETGQREVSDVVSLPSPRNTCYQGTQLRRESSCWVQDCHSLTANSEGWQ